MEGGDSLSRPTQRTNMKTDTKTTLTVHLDASDVRVSKLSNLLAIHDNDGNTLNIFLSSQGLAALRQALAEPALAVVDS